MNLILSYYNILERKTFLSFDVISKYQIFKVLFLYRPFIFINKIICLNEILTIFNLIFLYILSKKQTINRLFMKFRIRKEKNQQSL